jgi:transposase InsO family protein
VGLPQWRYTGIHRPGRAGSERLRRIIQWLRSSERSFFRDECLNEELGSIPAGWFLDLEDAKTTIEAWRIDYNTNRPHSALGYATPEDFASSLQGHAPGEMTTTAHKGKITTLDPHAG